MDTSAGGGSVKLGSAALEEILCRVAPVGILGNLVPHAVDAWSIEFPDLGSLPRFEDEPARLRICIATEDIVGPVRNGGIGTTYSALSELLAKLGHDVTILYLKGQEVENGTIEQWIEFYAAKSVRFVPVPNYAAVDRFQTGADRWLHAPYNMLKYLTDHPMDVVHVSEWRGSGYLCLLAKRQHLAFQETLFVVKTSSPWIWSTLYGSQPLDRVDDLVRLHAERRSVEFADMVIGGSLHLLRWMASQGYKIPRDRTFVQPNVATFDHLSGLRTTRNWERGKRHPIDEVVFFGRLEARKGLFTFVQAIKRLLRQGQALPKKITFMGKPGARLMARPDQDIVDYIAEETKDWPTTVEVLSDFPQYDALQYLLSGNRLAVMPSMIENSSLAVYEAAICGIPFIASASGGTPELVASIDHPHVLCEAHPIPLAEKIEEALRLGGYVARASFDNAENLEQWRRFHLDLGRGLLKQLLPPIRKGAEILSTVSVCIYHAGSDEKLQATLASIKEQDHPPEEILIAVDTDNIDGLANAQSVASAAGVTATIVPAFDFDAGHAFNLLARQVRSEYMLFLWAGSTIRPMALRALTKVAASSNANLLNYFFRVTHDGDQSSRDYLSAIVFGNVAQSFFRTDVTSLPLLVRRHTFAELGGFSTDYRVLAHDHELVAKAQISGVHCETALLELGTVPAWDEEWLKAKCYDQSVAQFRAIRPELAATPLALRELLLMAKGLQKSGGRRKVPGKAQKVKKVEAEAEGPIGRLLMALSRDLHEEPSDGGPKKPAPAGQQAKQPGGQAGAGKSPGQTAEAARPPSKAPGSPGGGPVKSKVVAADIRKDRVAAKQASLRGAGLVQLIDELSADPLEVPPAKPAAPTARARISDPRPPVKPSRQAGPQPDRLHSGEGRNYSGRFLGVHQGIAYGWVRNDDQPKTPVVVDVMVDGNVPQEVRADIDLPTAMVMPPQMRGHGFAIPLSKKWRGLFSRKSTKDVLLRVNGTDIEIARLAVRRNADQLEEAGYDGHCDAADAVDGVLRGWVWQPSDPDAVVDISVFVDGKFLTRVAAGSVRDDVRAAGIGSGHYGFAVPVPKPLCDGTPRQIDVVVAHAGVLLKGGQLTMVGERFSVRERSWRLRAA